MNRILRTLSFAALALLIVPPAAAQWYTTRWVVMDEKSPHSSAYTDFAEDWIAPTGERGIIAEKHRGILEAASAWFQSLGFRAPNQQMADVGLPGSDVAFIGRLKRDPSDGSSEHSTSGQMHLTSSPDFLAADTPMWTLLEATSVHELYHAIQHAYPSLVARREARTPTLPECPGASAPETGLTWLIEGTAAMVQVRWLEGQHGPWGHPFRGSHRAAWVRHFDQPLHFGSLPPEHRKRTARPLMTEAETVSWYCGYGTWYFWYAVGDMIGRNDAEKVAYTRYIYDKGQSWTDGGVAEVDAGLRAAAEAYNAIRPFRNGLYDLYPQFVAQYLTEDRFYGHLEVVELGTPALFETTSSLTGGPLGALASRAWRVRVRLPQNASPIPYTVRFTLSAEGETDRDALHLIVGDRVAGRPVDPTAPYALVERTDQVEPAADGTVEYLVRVANVAEAAAETTPADFSLRVEVEGFYGEEVAGGAAGSTADAIPPGFSVSGPGSWACSGGADARAFFDLMTPDEQARMFDRSLPQFERNVENRMDELEIVLQRAEREGTQAGMTREELAAIRAQIREMMEASIAEARPDFEQYAEEARAGTMTGLAATFVGQGDGGECQMLLRATLQGREGGVQTVTWAVDENLHPSGDAPAFEIGAFGGASLQALRTRPVGASRLDGWEVCTMTSEERRHARDLAAQTSCPLVTCSAGRLTLEAAEQGRIAGSFQFEVVRWPEDRYDRACDVPEARDTVTGYFNVTSTDDGYDAKGLTGISSPAGIIPGQPILPARGPGDSD